MQNTAFPIVATPNSKPIIGITTGDPAGIGPEIILKALAERSIWRICRPVIIGRPSVIISQAAVLGWKLKLIPVANLGEFEGRYEPNTYYIHPTGPSDETDRTRLGQADAGGGRVAYEAIKEATDLALQARIAAIVTAPINKHSLSMAGINYPGHTEMIADMCHSDQEVMMMIGGGLKVVLATIHCPLRAVFERLTIERLLSVLRVTHTTFKRLGQSDVMIGVCGLNPHAGESGLFGDEEREIITPAIRAAAAEGMRISGPFPADSLFYRAKRGEFGVVVAMYHDQGLIPIKTLDFDRGVNITLGLPIIRTSVDHGTAFDIAGQNKASGDSMIAAITAAVELARGELT